MYGRQTESGWVSVRSLLTRILDNFFNSTRSAMIEGGQLIDIFCARVTQQCVNVGVCSPASTSTTLLRCPQG